MNGDSSNPAERAPRVQSPSYPSMSLKDAISAVGLIESKYRSAVIDRENAATLLGYSGLTGPANMALASLAAFALTERAGKGEIRVTELARSILHPDNESERRKNLDIAASSPGLYRDLRERYRGVASPPDDAVRTYLNRLGFNPNAVQGAAKAFLQTMNFLQEAGVTESSGQVPGHPQESAAHPPREESPKMTYPTQGQPAYPPPMPQTIIASDDLPLNEPAMSIRGNTVRVEALLDFDGLTELENHIKALKMILKRKPAVTPSSETH